MPITLIKNNPKVLNTLDPTKEYVVGGILVSPSSGMESLSVTNDDIMREYSPRIYDQMMQDPEIAKCVNLLKISILGDGVTFIPSVAELDQNYEEAFNIANFCTSAVRNLKKPLRDTLEQMLDALIYGHKIAEITYKIDTIKNYPGDWLILDSVKVKSIGSVRFIVDKTMNILGFTGNTLYDFNNNSQKTSDVNPITPLESGKITTKNDKVYINVDGKNELFLERDKFMVLTIRGKDEDPRGQSLLRPAFNAWHLKTQIFPEYFRYLLMCAIPLLVGFTPPDETTGVQDIQRDSDGNIMKDSQGRLIQVSSVNALRDALLQARNATTLALKGGSQIKEIGANGSGVAFTKALDSFNQEMEMAILLQTLATSEGEHQSRSASQTHMGVLDMLVWWFKGVVTDMLITDLLRPLIRYNFGDDALEFLPKVSLGDTERRDFSIDAQAIAALYNVQYLSEEQKRYTDAMLGLPVRDNSYDNAPLSPVEALSLSQSLLEHKKLETDINRLNQQSNSEKVNQLKALKELLNTISLSTNKEGKPVQSVQSLALDAGKQSQILTLMDQLITEISNQTLDSKSLTETALDVKKRAVEILRSDETGGKGKSLRNNRADSSQTKTNTRTPPVRRNNF